MNHLTVNGDGVFASSSLQWLFFIENTRGGIKAHAAPMGCQHHGGGVQFMMPPAPLKIEGDALSCKTQMMVIGQTHIRIVMTAKGENTRPHIGGFGGKQVVEFGVSGKNGNGFVRQCVNEFAFGVSNGLQGGKKLPMSRGNGGDDGNMRLHPLVPVWRFLPLCSCPAQRRQTHPEAIDWQEKATLPNDCYGSRELNAVIAHVFEEFVPAWLCMWSCRHFP